MASPMMKMSHEGRPRRAHGRPVGGVITHAARRASLRILLLSQKLAEEGTKYVQQGIEMIEKFPEVAKY